MHCNRFQADVQRKSIPTPLRRISALLLLNCMVSLPIWSSQVMCVCVCVCVCVYKCFRDDIAELHGISTDIVIAGDVCVCVYVCV